MRPRRTLQQEEIENLQQEIVQLQQRLSRLERRKGTKCVRTDDDEGISDNQISSTHKDKFEGSPRQFSSTPSIEFCYKGFENSLPKSLFVPLYDEPMYDAYDDDMIGGVLDHEQLAYDVNNDSKREGQHNIKDDSFLSFELINSTQWRTSNETLKFPQLKKEPLTLLNLQPKSQSIVQSLPKSNMEFLDLSFRDFPVNRSKISISYSNAAPAGSSSVDSMLGICLQMEEINNVLVKATHKIDNDRTSDQVIKTMISPVPLHAILTWEVSHGSSSYEFSVKDTEDVLSAKTWEYPDRFSQPNPPPYGGQPDIFL